MQLGQFMMESGSMTELPIKDKLFMRTKINMKEISLMEKKMEWVSIIMRPEENIKGSG